MIHEKEEFNDEKVEVKEPDPMDVDIQACSATDCTGLIPAMPEDEAQMEAYEDLYPYLTEALPQAKNKENQ